jgi:hypothetical protein
VGWGLFCPEYPCPPFFASPPPTPLPHSYYRAFGPKRADHVALLVQNNMNWTRVEDNLKAARAGDADAASGVV